MKEKLVPNIYSEEFKWRVVKEVLEGRYSKEEAKRIYGIRGKSAVLYWMRQFSGVTDYRKGGIPLCDIEPMESSKELRLLQQRITELEQERDRERLRADLWQKMVELAEEHLKIDIKKKFGARQSKPFAGKATKN